MSSSFQSVVITEPLDVNDRTDDSRRASFFCESPPAARPSQNRTDQEEGAMTKRILTPIDTDERSEAIVPVVAALARDTGATVRLLRVFPIPERVVGDHGRTVAYVDQEMERLTHEGLEDLARVATALTGAPVECVVRFGEPEAEVLVEAEAFHADLIAVTAERHGRLRGALAPDLGERIASKAPIPTLVLRG
jgi:nucleotide-binding universal stress UspA family protein